MNWDYNQLETITTPRCYLRPIRQSDASAILRLYSNANVIHYTEHHQPMDSLQEAEYTIHFYRKGYIEGWMYRWGVTLSEKDIVIGTAGLHRLNRDHHYCSIGYEIDEPYWNKGLSTEIVGALTTYGFTSSKMNRIEAELFPENMASARVLQKNGYRYEATRHQRMYNRQAFHDIDIYAILRREWVDVKSNQSAY